MSENASSLIIWSYGIAAFSYAFLFSYLLKQAFSQSPGVPGRALLVALGLTVLWSVAAVAATLFESVLFLSLHFLLDSLRYAAWFGSLLLLVAPSGRSLLERLFQGRSLAAFTLGIVAAAVACQWLAMMGFTSPALVHVIQLTRLAITVCGLVLLEQLLRNSTADTRWNFKPLGLGLAASFVFDLYLYSNTAMFNQI